MIDPRLINPEDIQPLTDIVTPTPRFYGEGSITGGQVQLGQIYGPSQEEVMYGNLASIAQSAGQMTLIPQQIEQQQERQRQLQQRKKEEEDRNKLLAYDQFIRDTLNAKERGVSFSYQGTPYDVSNSDQLFDLQSNAHGAMLHDMQSLLGQKERTIRLGTLLEGRNKSLDQTATDLHTQWKLKVREIQENPNLHNPVEILGRITNNPELNQINRQIAAMGDNPTTQTREDLIRERDVILAGVQRDASTYMTREVELNIESSVLDYLDNLLKEGGPLTAAMQAGDPNDPMVVNALAEAFLSETTWGAAERIGIEGVGGPSMSIRPDSLADRFLQGHDIPNTAKEIYREVFQVTFEEQGFNNEAASRLSRQLVTKIWQDPRGSLKNLVRGHEKIEDLQAQNNVAAAQASAINDILGGNIPSPGEVYIASTKKETSDRIALFAEKAYSGEETFAEARDTSSEIIDNGINSFMPDEDPISLNLIRGIGISIEDAVESGYYEEVTLERLLGLGWMFTDLTRQRLYEQVPQVESETYLRITKKGREFREGLRRELQDEVRNSSVFNDAVRRDTTNIQRGAIAYSFNQSFTLNQLEENYQKHFLNNFIIAYPELGNLTYEELNETLGQGERGAPTTSDLGLILNQNQIKTVRDLYEQGYVEALELYNDRLKNEREQNRIPEDTPFGRPFTSPSKLDYYSKDAMHLRGVEAVDYVLDQLNNDPNFPVDSWFRSQFKSDTPEEEMSYRFKRLENELTRRRQFHAKARIAHKFMWNTPLGGETPTIAYMGDFTSLTGKENWDVSVLSIGATPVIVGSFTKQGKTNLAYDLARVLDPNTNSNTRAEFAKNYINAFEDMSIQGETGERARQLVDALTKGLLSIKQDTGRLTRSGKIFEYSVDGNNNPVLRVNETEFNAAHDALLSEFSLGDGQTRAFSLSLRLAKDSINGTQTFRDWAAALVRNSSGTLSNSYPYSKQSMNELGYLRDSYIDDINSPIEQYPTVTINDEEVELDSHENLYRQRLHIWDRIVSMRDEQNARPSVSRIATREDQTRFESELLPAIIALNPELGNMSVLASSNIADQANMTILPGGDRRTIEEGDSISLREWVSLYVAHQEGRLSWLNRLGQAVTFSSLDEKDFENLSRILSYPMEQAGGYNAFRDHLRIISTTVESSPNLPSLSTSEFLSLLMSMDVARETPFSQTTLVYTANNQPHSSTTLVPSGYPRLPQTLSPPTNVRAQDGETVRMFHNNQHQDASTILLSTPNAVPEKDRLDYAKEVVRMGNLNSLDRITNEGTLNALAQQFVNSQNTTVAEFLADNFPTLTFNFNDALLFYGTELEPNFNRREAYRQSGVYMQSDTSGRFIRRNGSDYSDSNLKVPPGLFRFLRPDQIFNQLNFEQSRGPSNRTQSNAAGTLGSIGSIASLLTQTAMAGLPPQQEIAQLIMGEEGFISTPRKATPKENYLTVGHGHKLDGSKRSRDAFKKTFPNKNYDEFMAGRGSLTKKEALKLFEADLPDYIKRAESFTNYEYIKDPKTKERPRGKKLGGLSFKDHSPELQKYIISATYRGTWGQSQKARKLLSEGKYEAAAKEFLDNDEYRQAIKTGRRGIRTRMEAVAKAIRSEGQRQIQIEEERKRQEAEKAKNKETAK